jgi:predicted nucleotidyltransferase
VTNNQFQDPRLEKIITHLKEQYNCHTFILYGSRARGDETSASDYDILAIRDNGSLVRETQKFEEAFLDCFIYSMDEIKEPSQFLGIKDGIIICQKDKIGTKLLKEVKNIYSKGPIPKKEWEKQVIVNWGKKMIERAKVGDIEGKFRAHWLLYDLLESYFQLRDLWYLGPKVSFQWLKVNDAITYELFEKVLNQTMNVENLEELMKRVTLMPAS